MNAKRILMAAGVIALAGTLSACGPHHSREAAVEHADWMVAALSHKLDLTPDQKGRLEAVKGKLLAERDAAVARRDADRREVLDLLSQPTLDRARVQALVTRHTRAIEADAPAVIAAFGDFHDSLNDSQRRQLRERVESRMASRHGP